MNLLGVIDQLATKKPEPFVAPIPFARTVSVLTMQDGAPWRLSVIDPRPGWWVLQPQGNKLARIDKLAQPADYLDYLESLPRFYVIALYPTSETTWLVVPYSIADANQRGWKYGVPREIHLVRMAIQPFDILVTRAMAGTLLFDDIDTRLGKSTITGALQESLNSNEEHPFVHDVNWRNAYQTVYARTKQILEDQRQKDSLRRLQEAKATTEQQIKWHLEFMGAVLNDIQHNRGGYLVSWSSPDGHTYDMRVGHNMHIEAAGLCLSGGDRLQNLSSIVSVMQEAVKKRRPMYNGFNPAQYDDNGYEDEDD